MNIKVHSIHFKADQKLLDLIQEKCDRIENAYDKVVACEVFLRLDNDAEGENKVVEIKTLVPGKELFAKKQSKTFEEAVDLAAEALRIQAIKHKEKLVAS